MHNRRIERAFQIIGILNVTPDSYFDGGQFTDADAAVRHAAAMIQSGADWIEVGGESTGPGSPDVSLEEEIRRVIPVVEILHEEYPELRIAVDTYKAEVAERAIAAGATLINDITAGRGDERMLQTIAASEALYCMMYAKDSTPRTTVEARAYADVIKDISLFLLERVQAARTAGIPDQRIILDPGLGHFVSSDPQYSFQIIARLEKICERGFPVLVSPSRKSFLAGLEQLPTKERLPGTLAASAIAVTHGAQFIRTHDVSAVARACEIAAAIATAGE